MPTTFLADLVDGALWPVDRHRVHAACHSGAPVVLASVLPLSVRVQARGGCGDCRWDLVSRGAPLPGLAGLRATPPCAVPVPPCAPGPLCVRRSAASRCGCSGECFYVFVTCEERGVAAS